MSTERVDKAWQRKGLKEYSTESILGTLGHYGIQVGEAEFRQLADQHYPVGIAESWAARWKGTGQFAPFHYAAAEELWRRWMGEKLAPTEFTESLAGLIGALGARLQGSPQAPVGPAFERMASMRQRLPLDEKGEPQPSFMQEALRFFDEQAARAFDSLAELLAKAGHVEDAEAFADLEEFLLPERRGVSRAIVRAAKGEREAAIEDLEAVAGDGSRPLFSRLVGVDRLLHLQAHEQVVALGRPLMEEAERNQDWHLALDLCDRVEHACKAMGDRTALLAVQRDKARIEAAHEAAHPGHRHHRH